MNIKQRDREYWQKRFEEVAKRSNSKGDAYNKDLVKLFNDTTKEMDTHIQGFYAKYGKVKESPTFKTLSDGTKVISGTAKKLVVPIEEANRPLLKGTRLSKLKAQLYSILKNMADNQHDVMKEALTTTAEESYYSTIYELYKGVGVGQSFNLLTKQQVYSLIRNEVNGQAFSTRVWTNRDKLANTVNQTLKAGIVQGLSNREMSKRIAKDMYSGLNVAHRLLRTEITNSSNQASLLGYERSGIVKEYEYLATMDDRTSAVCADLDAEVFKTKDATTGLNFPPMHVNCRSTTVPYFGDEKTYQTRIARGLDGNTFTVPATMNARDFRAIYVDKTITRKEWDKKYK